MDNLFNEVHSFYDSKLAFVKSLNVQAYPCGRRRALVNPDQNLNTADSYYIPFDPEARLNTEANNRKYSSLNGFSQTYIQDWRPSQDYFTLVLGGYFFKIASGGLGYEVNTFANSVLDKLGESNNVNVKKIYANIRTEYVPLFASEDLGGTHLSSVLRNQSDEDDDGLNTATTYLDLCREPVGTEVKNQEFVQTPDNYYFSGLSFSIVPITGLDEIRSEKSISSDDKPYQQEFSLCILDKAADDSWQICQQALLPEIAHGTEPGSVDINILNVKELRQDNTTLNTLTIGADTNGTPQLVFKSIKAE